MTSNQLPRKGNLSTGWRAEVGRGDSALNAETEATQLRSNEHNMSQHSRYAAEGSAQAGMSLPNEADCGIEPLAQPTESGTAAINSTAPFDTTALEPTPLRATQVGFDINGIGQEIKTSNRTNVPDAFAHSFFSGITPPIPFTTTQPRNPLTPGSTGVAPEVSSAPSVSSQLQPTQWPVASGINNQNLVLQQQNLALLQMLQYRVLMIPQEGGSLGSGLSAAVPHANFPLGFPLQTSSSGQSVPVMPDGGAMRTGIDGARAAAINKSVRNMGTPSVHDGVGVAAEKSRSRYTGERKPKRALTAYNIFFKDERVRLLEDVEKSGPEGSEGATLTENGRESKRRRRQQKKIGFEDMGKIIGKRWKQLSLQKRSYYNEQAATETKRYKEELAIYNRRQSSLIEAERLRREATVSEETRKLYLETGEKNRRSNGR